MNTTGENIGRNAVLVLEDGSVFPGWYFGAEPMRSADLPSAPPPPETEGCIGEVVFNTGMTGYYEILTDPSYTGQMVVMTYPHIGNYGVDRIWSETAREEGTERPGVKPAGLIVRKLYQGEVPKGRRKLADVLSDNGVTGIEGVDTRGLTLKIREGGSPRGMVLRCGAGGLDEEELSAAVEVLRGFPSMEGRNLLGRVGTRERYGETPPGPGPVAEDLRIALIDCGVKANIPRELLARGAAVDVFPSGSAGPKEILRGGYNGVMLSNGPGDPACLTAQIDLVRGLLGNIPVCGICLGHQLISLAFGGTTYKMKFGHHGLNHPVIDRKTGRVFVTSQNHGFSVDPDSLPADVKVRFINANDTTVEGINHTSLPILSVQFHPEACPGPLDSLWLFDEFISLFKAS